MPPPKASDQGVPSPMYTTPTTPKFTVLSNTPTPPPKQEFPSLPLIHSDIGESKKSIGGIKLKSQSNKNKTNSRKASKQPLSVVDPARSDRGNRFCECINFWTFEELRSEAITYQTRTCPRCHQPFEKVIFIEKRLTTREILLSPKGIFMIITALLQYSIVFFAAYVAIIDVLLASDNNFMPFQRKVLLGLTVVFILATITSVFRSIVSSARALVDNAGDKHIADVLPDLHCR